MAREFLKQVKIATPCPMLWSEMEGNDRSRFCKSCNLHVFNLSDMTDREAEDLVRGTTGRLCGRYYERADGTIMTKDCKRGLAGVRRQLILSAFAFICLMVASFAYAVRPVRRSAPVKSVEQVKRELRAKQPFAGILDQVDPIRQYAGAVVVLPRKGP
jgi:hypothetical protein